MSQKQHHGPTSTPLCVHAIGLKEALVGHGVSLGIKIGIGKEFSEPRAAFLTRDEAHQMVSLCTVWRDGERIQFGQTEAFVHLIKSVEIYSITNKKISHLFKIVVLVKVNLIVWTSDGANLFIF